LTSRYLQHGLAAMLHRNKAGKHLGWLMAISPQSILQGDENVLFILNQDRQLRAGTDYLSYTLNRVK
jgi:hypothetical protein